MNSSLRSNVLFVAAFLLTTGRMLAQDPSLIFPQFADGGGIRTEIILGNPSPSVDSGVVFFRTPEGGPLPVFINGMRRSSMQYAVSPGGTFRIATDGVGDTQSGYAVVQSENPQSKLTGVLVYRFGAFEVSVPDSPLSSDKHLVVVRHELTNSGLALANPGLEGIHITLQLLGRQGQQVEVKDLTLGPGQQQSKFITEIFTDIGPRFTGSIQASSLSAFSMLALRQRTDGSLAVISGSSENAKGGRFLTQLANGDGLRSEILLINRNDIAMQGTLLFFNDAGEPLSLGINGATQSLFEFALPPRGVERLETDGDGPLVTGYAEIASSTEGAGISGSIVYSLFGFEVSVPLSSSTKEVNLSVQRSSEANSGIAFLNPTEEQAELTALLLDSEGRRVNHAQVILEPRQKTARFINEIFPRVLSLFDGSVHINSNADFSAVALRQRLTGSLSVLGGSALTLPSSRIASKATGAVSIGVHRKGETFVTRPVLGNQVKTNAGNDTLWFKETGESFWIRTDGAGLPQLASSAGYILIWEYFTSHSADFVILTPDDDVITERGVELPPSLLDALRNTPHPMLSVNQARAVLLSSCAASSLPHPIPNLDQVCASELVSALSSLPINLSENELEIGFSAIGCDGALPSNSCADQKSAEAEVLLQDYEEERVARSEEIQGAIAQLACADISGAWLALEEGTLTCTASANGQMETFTDPIKAEGTISINQQGCRFHYDPGMVVGGERTGTVTRETLELSGLALIPEEGVMVSENRFEATGTIEDGMIELEGTGIVSATVESEGTTVSLSCDVNTTAIFQRGNEIDIVVMAFIPANYLRGPSSCVVGLQSLDDRLLSCVSLQGTPAAFVPLFFEGDDRGFSLGGSARTSQGVRVQMAPNPRVMTETEFSQTGTSRAFAPDALLDGRIDDEDRNDSPGDCSLLYAESERKTDPGGFTVGRIPTTAPDTVAVRLTGGARNPLLGIAPSIDWVFDVTLEPAGPNRVFWSLQGSHDGFPAYQVAINERIVYTFPVIQDDINCLGLPDYSLGQVLKLAFPREIQVSTSGVLPIDQ